MDLVHASFESRSEFFHAPRTSLTPAQRETLDIVRKESPPLIDQIFDDWEKLGKIMAVHSHTLQRRWRKRAVGERKRVLLKAWDGMCPMHRPGLYYLSLLVAIFLNKSPILHEVVGRQSLPQNGNADSVRFHRL